MLIEKVSPSDLESLQEIARATFYETFSVFNSEEDMRHYLEHDFSAEKLLAQIDNPGSEFYFARIDHEIAGYLKVNTGDAQTERQPGNTFEIERIYVSSHFHGKQVGQLLCEKAIELALDKKADFIWLGVWENNPRAIRFYEKNGFVPFGKHLFRLGDDEQTDVLMRKVLSFMPAL